MLPVSLPAAGYAAGPPVPGHKPEPPAATTGTAAAPRQPEALAVPDAPSLATPPVPARPKGAPAPGGEALAAAPTAPDFPSPPIPSPPPALRDQTAALPPDPGPAPSAAPGVPTPPAMATLPRPPGLPEERIGMAPPPDPGPGPGTPAAEGREFSVVFGNQEEEAALSPDDRTLLSGIAARMARDQNARLELRSYASGTQETRREARRLSLLRAIDIREFLVGQGVRGTRIDVRALGTDAQAPAGRAADRIDLVLVN